MSLPLVSILTPSYQQARWLGDNLASVDQQDYPNLEHLVADGGSTDGTIAVLEESSVSRLSWSSEPDRGQAEAINKAFSRSSGDIIGWLNSDDAYYRRDAVSLAVVAFERNPEAVAVYGHAVLVNAAGRVLQVMWQPPYSRPFLRVHNFLVQPAVFVRRSAVADHMVDPSLDFMVDWELWLRLAQVGTFARIDRILAIDRHHADRKVIARPDLGARDRVVLGTRYALASGPVAGTAVKALTVAHRLVGATHIAEARSVAPALPVVRDSSAELLRRQLSVPRSAMALDS